MKVREIIYNNKIHNPNELKNDNILFKIMTINNDVVKTNNETVSVEENENIIENQENIVEEISQENNEENKNE